MPTWIQLHAPRSPRAVWPRRAPSGCALALVLAVFVVAPAGAIELSPCYIDGVDEQVRCGTHTVYEDRSAQSGRTIELQIAVLPALTDTPRADPMLVLAGGPGQSAISIAGFVDRILGPLQSERDIVLIDQRGTGGSNALTCDLDDDSLEVLDPGRVAELAADCLKGLEADVRHYTTANAVDDFHEVLQALGFRSVNLYGVSYGSRAGLVFMRRYPEFVRSAVFDGIAPPGMRIGASMGADAQRAMEAAAAACAADEVCRERFPDLRAGIAELLAGLETPQTVTYPDPRTGEPTEATLDRARVALSLRGILYSARLTSLLPLLVDEARAGRFGPLMAASSLGDSELEDLSVGLHWSVLCSEDIGRMGAEDLPAAEERSFVGRAQAEILLAACSVWPAGELPAGFDEPVRSDVPTLLLSGEIDPVTPPAYGDDAERYLDNAVHLVAKATGHNVSPMGCAPELIESFVQTPAPETVDGECLDRLTRPGFFVAPTGPTP